MASMANGVNGVVQDRLSEMPDEVILHILSCMSTLDAVRTMLLRRFRELWTLVPALSFDFGEYYQRMIDSLGMPDAPSSFHLVFSCFSRFVRNVLMLHRRSTIDSFHLYMYLFDEYFEDPNMIDDVQMWLRFAASRGVKDVYFAFNGPDDLVPPRCVFTCQSIVTLTLSGCMIDEYEDERPLHMGALRNLSLICVHGCNDAFNQLIYGCPLLEELILYKPRGLRLLNMTIPSVAKLDLDLDDVVDDPVTLHCPNVKILDIAISTPSPPFQLWVTDVSSLQVVNIKDLPNKCSSGLVKAIVKHFRNAEGFSLSRKALKQLSPIKKLDVPENSWKRLVLQPWWNHERCFQVILMLVTRSVKLEELIIDVGQSSDKYELLWSELSTPGWKPLLYPELHTTCVFPLLKTVTINGYGKCGKGLLELVEILLRNAVVLEKLFISLGPGLNHLTAIEELDFVKQVSSFKRASTNASVVFG